jgi:hypothetical protein
MTIRSKGFSSTLSAIAVTSMTFHDEPLNSRHPESRLVF